MADDSAWREEGERPSGGFFPEEPEVVVPRETVQEVEVEDLPEDEPN